MSARVAAYAAIGISSVAVIMCVLFVPMLWGRISTVNDRIDLAMADFHMTKSGIDRVLRDAGDKPDAQSIFGLNREKRQAAQCNCDANTKCPAGPPGVQLSLLASHTICRSSGTGWSRWRSWRAWRAWIGRIEGQHARRDDL